MPAFDSQDAIMKSLWGFGLGKSADRILASARPCLCFSRTQAKDAEHALFSKIGGDPVLPSSTPWPVRPPLPNADARAQELDQSHQASLSFRSEDPFKYLPESTLASMSQEDRDAFAETMKIMSAPEQLDAIERSYRAERDAIFHPMPLAFAGHLHLDELSRLDGFDTDLPKSGLLSFFQDATHFDGPATVLCFASDQTWLERKEAPGTLIDFYKAQGHDDAVPWQDADQCERLNPVSAWSVPQHWDQLSDIGMTFSDWTWNGSHILTLSDNEPAEDGDFPTTMDFGEQLGGFPVPVQDHPEYDMLEGPPKPFDPGNSPWRLLFSNSAEFMHGTRAFPGGDGQYYWMMHETALAQHDFTKVRLPYQQT